MYGPTIDSLIRSGACVLLHDYRSGTAYDWSGHGNVGTLSSGCRFTGPASALTFPATTEEVTVADAPELRLTAGSIVAVAGQGGFVSQTLAWVLDKITGGFGFRFYYSDALIVFFGDGGGSAIEKNIVGSKSIGVTFQSGGKPISYLNGINGGNLSAVVTVSASAASLIIGNNNNNYPNPNPFAAVLIANRILTPTEMAQVHAELVNAKWPSKQTAIARRVQGSVIGEANLLAGYTLRPSGLSVPSHDGAFTGTLSGQAQHVNSILGDALSLGRTTGAVDLGVGNAQIDPTTDSHWVEVWARPLDVAMSDIYVPIIGKGAIGAVTYRAPGIAHLADRHRAWWTDGVGAAVVVDSMIVPRNKLTHLLMTVDHGAHQIYLYIDGVQYGPTAITTMAALQATNWVVGKYGSTSANFDESFGGLVVNPRIGTGVLTPAQVQARYLEGAKAIQFKTDWGYPISAANEGGVTGQQIGGFASPFYTGDDAGRWMVTTATIEGRLCKVLKCTREPPGDAALAYIPASCFHGATPTEAAFGSWEWWAMSENPSEFDVNFIATTNTGITTGYGIKWDSAAEEVFLYEYGVGAKITASPVPIGAPYHHFRITRTITGLFTLYIDGVARGTATDTTTLTSAYVVLSMYRDQYIALGDVSGGHGLIKMLGVVAP